MNYSLLRSAWVSALILGLATSCTTTVHLEALAPASVPMPPTLQRIATANRILPDSRRDKFFDVLEGIFTGEGPMVDRAGAEACVLSTGEALMRNSPRFRVTPANLQLVGRTREFFLPPMSPDYVRRVCRTSQVDGLVVLEAFDSDMQLQRSQEERVIKEKDKPDRKVLVTVVHMDMRVVTGFRTYGPEGLVVDQARQEDHLGWTSEGATYQAALAGLPAPERCIRDVARRVGDQYARRIAPSYVPLTRNVYTRAKKNPHMEQARQCVQATDWTQAAARWQQAARNLNHVVAGRAFYNLAVFEEMNNRLPEAIDYARKAAYTCQMRPAVAYLRVLQDRQQAEQLVQTQMAGSRAK
ncbi:hypothetical protein E5K00_11060 [Hymenobacter aquaticus]|uniref:Tetratricopeptide repeat protein n=1 Tax=Hymenobacter aquaticus TaxID=1867101 RepID=A0A4Z0Q8G7_9BACT|nr:DUF6340 family protein [Hymenobacter aquaticus]TGE25699.1 hypothetical protein E5K00_11060 [Hymenobacter aquaticus]